MSITRALRVVASVSLLSLAAAGCGQDDPPGALKPDPPPKPQVDGKPVNVTLPAEGQAEQSRLTAVAASTKSMTADELMAKHAVPFRAQLGYDPRAALNLNLVQGSALKLNDAELAGLTKNGFVISKQRGFPHFAYAYQTIYMQDLPVFVSADSILQAVHQSYDDILKAIEIEALIPELTALLGSMRGSLPTLPGVSAATKVDVDLFLAVALSLLQDAPAAPVAGASMNDIGASFTAAKSAMGSAGLKLFGLDRPVDFSQFKPRGHYTDDPRLEKYFRTMMWLARIDVALIHTDEGTGKPVLVRQGVSGALALRALMDSAAFDRWKRVDATVRAFVGEPDSMAPPEVDKLKADLHITGNDVDASVSDEALAAALVAGAYGHQRILSQIVLQAPHDGETWPLDATFNFFGQRYVFDSHVFSNVVYDRVAGRMMPDPLDVAYAALGNDQAATLLGPQLKQYPYAGALESMRLLGNEHGESFWGANLYNVWLGALRTLSPTADVGRADAGLPAVAGTEPWGRRLLNTQLASWAQLRHDTILYAKQSYTSGAVCEFPDAYVEPYPAFFAQIEKLATLGGGVVQQLPLNPSSGLGNRIVTYFMHLGEVSRTLREMAEHQRSGMPHSAEHLAFINRAVKIEQVCGGPGTIEGWYADLFFVPNAEWDPTIADVHTQPTDQGGAPVGHVLHVGTGRPRLMVMTVDTCMGPRAYAGVVSAYHELITKDFERLNDTDWSKRFDNGQTPADVPWLNGVLVE
jgi:hypothetical protein